MLACPGASVHAATLGDLRGSAVLGQMGRWTVQVQGASPEESAADCLRASVRFETFNLMKHPGQLGQFDIVMLAHVLPSFDGETRAATLNRITETLAPEGVIILGEGETLPAGCDGLAITNGVIRKKSGQARAAA